MWDLADIGRVINIGVATISGILACVTLILEWRAYRQDSKGLTCFPVQARIRTLNMLFIVTLATTDLINVFNYPLALANGIHEVCLFQAGLMQVDQLASVLWTFPVCFFFFTITGSYTNGNQDQEKVASKCKTLWIIANGVCWGFPVATLISVLNNNSFGKSGNWCWIKPELKYEWWLFFYGELILVWIGNITLLVLHYRRNQRTYVPIAKAMNRMLAGYVWVFIIAWTFAVVDRTLMTIGKQNEIISFLHEILEPLQGSLNFAVYFYVHKVLKFRIIPEEESLQIEGHKI